MKGHENRIRDHAVFRSGQHMPPDDEQEPDELDIRYASLSIVLGGIVVFAPIVNPHRILDIGTGTGIWAIDASDAFPDATITANDLDAMQPSWVPPNVKFEIDDAESDWALTHAGFDLIHMRTMTGCIRNWDRLSEQCYQYTLPGGYIELQEMDCIGVVQSTSQNPGTSFLQWCTQLAAAAGKAGFPLRTSGELLRGYLEKAGFVDVEISEFKLPIGPWAKDKRLRDAGLLQLSSVLYDMDGRSLRLLTYYAGWTVGEVRVLLAKVRAELEDRNLHAYWPVYVVYGRKAATKTATRGHIAWSIRSYLQTIKAVP